MIKIDNKTNIKSIEEAYTILNIPGAVDITISKGLSSPDFGLIPALIQLFATWHNNTTGGKLIFNAKSEIELVDFYEADYLFPSLVYCWKREITDNAGNDIKPALRKQNLVMHEKMRKQTEGGGLRVLLSCFDHLSAKNGLLNAFYTDGLFITNEMQFDFAIDKSIKQVFTFNKSLLNTNLSPFHTEIIASIYELVKNTDDWGRTDQFNKPLNPNSRGLYLKLHRRKRESYSANFTNSEGLKDYFSDEGFETNSIGELYFLELSVYDTGIGFVQRNLGQEEKQLDTADQVAIIKKCLIKNNTTATGIEKGIKGQGLDRIMKILDNKGLFWLRTANVSVFRNLRKNRYMENGQVNDIELFDSLTNSSEAFSRLTYAKGSVVTLVYPISNLINA